jgi:mannose-6-phosphate isomerase-like protein (cupin superfamily)
VTGTGLLVADVSRSVAVHGVHGAAGLSHWSCLARRGGLDGGWEAVEWASVPAGGVSGEHRHTRTEEIYFVLSGQGELLLNGEPTPVGPGSTALTQVGSTHGLRNVAEEPLDWLVIELLSPHTEAVVRGLRYQEQEYTLPSTVLNLRDVGEFDPRAVFASPLDHIGIVSLEPGAEQELTAHDHEHTIFVLAGEGTAEFGETRLPVRESMSLTLPLGSALRLRAGRRGLEFFIASLQVEVVGR